MKIVSISPLAADPMKNKLILEDGTVVHVLKSGPQYEVGGQYEEPKETTKEAKN